jgi:hypothetical protein
VDDQELAVGPVTRTLQAAYLDTVRGRRAAPPGWLDYVGVAAAA